MKSANCKQGPHTISHSIKLTRLFLDQILCKIPSVSSRQHSVLISRVLFCKYVFAVNSIAMNLLQSASKVPSYHKPTAAGSQGILLLFLDQILCKIPSVSSRQPSSQMPNRSSINLAGNKTHCCQLCWIETMKPHVSAFVLWWVALLHRAAVSCCSRSCSSSVIVHKEVKNRHNTVFGLGFNVRRSSKAREERGREEEEEEEQGWLFRCWELALTYYCSSSSSKQFVWLVESSRVVTAASSAATAIRNRAPISPEALNLWPSFPGHGLLLQARKMVQFSKLQTPWALFLSWVTEIFGGEIVSSTLLSVCTPDFGMQMRMQVLERGGFQAGKQKEENPSLVISAINLARILPDVPRNQKSRGGFWIPHQPQLQQR